MLLDSEDMKKIAAFLYTLDQIENEYGVTVGVGHDPLWIDGEIVGYRSTDGKFDGASG